MKTREEVLNILLANNATAKKYRLIMYCDLYMDYQHAAKNIRDNGSICAHPKTGAPLENPYLKVRNQVQKELVKIIIKSDDLWEK